MDGHRDSSRSRHDDFVRPPSFHDGLASPPLDAATAKWSRRSSASIALGSIVAVIGVVAAIALMMFVAPASAPGAPDGAQGVAAEDDGPRLDDGIPSTDAQAVLANATSSPAIPTISPP